jgi:hypothetical protein
MTREQCGGDGIIVRDGMPISAPGPEDVIGYDALWDSMLKCRCGVMWKGSVARFCIGGAESVSKLCEELHDGTYRPRKTTTFRITSPKPRTITSTPFRDRVYQRSLNDNTLYPTVARSLIYDNTSCQEGKGLDFAMNRLKCHLQRHWRKHGLDGWVLQVDVAGYYPNMPHSVGEAVFDCVPPWARTMAVDVLRSQYAGDVGYNPGSQMVQIVGIAALNKVDHRIKERMGIKGYVRYMDDLLLIHHDREHLEWCLQEIDGMLRGIGMQVSWKKTRIRRICDQIPFLGFNFRLKPTGKVVVAIKPEKVKQMRRRIRRLRKLEAMGARPPGTAEESYLGWRAHAAKGDSRLLLERCDRWFYGLREELTDD